MDHFVSITTGKRTFTVKELTDLVSTVPEDAQVSIMGSTYFGVFRDENSKYILLDEVDPD